MKTTKLFISKFIFILLFFYFPLISYSQREATQISSSIYSLYSSGQELPFWFTANQQGIFEHANKSYSIGDLSLQKDFNLEKKWDLNYGARAIYAKGDNTYHQLNEWYAGIKYKSFYLKVGAFPEKTVYEGLSSSNANIDWSNNARPMPRIRISTTDYIPLPFGKESKFWHNVTFKAIYDEAFFNDESRYVQNAHLHHKMFYLRKQINEREHITLGGDHYVMWGGTSPDFGELPGFKSYLRTILFLPGSKEGPVSDQEYFSGNHLGMYYVDYEKKYRTGTFTLYINHPFDHLPVVVQNLFDNLIGFSFSINKKGFISDILLEMMNTNDQSGVMTVRNPGDPTAYYESLFKHGEYQSGLSYENRIIASPFFSPMVIIDGKNYGTGNNRVALLHIALKGYLHKNIRWKYFISYSRNSGVYGSPSYDIVVPGYFNMTRHKFSMFGEINYEIPKTGLNISLAGASDMGHLDHNYGIMFKLEKALTILK